MKQHFSETFAMTQDDSAQRNIQNLPKTSTNRHETGDLTAQPAPPGDEHPVVAELVSLAPNTLRAWPQDLPPVLQNVSAVGGAIGSVVLGTWAILGSLLTPYSGINGAIGFVLGVWGMSSRRRTMAIIGIVLSLLGIGMSLVKVSEIISIYFTRDVGL